MTTHDFLASLNSLALTRPRYRLGGDGSDGTCDCIGAIIGACRRLGVEWPGIHGSNWAARNAVRGLCGFSRPSALSLGDMVFKARAPGQSGYALPRRYRGHPDQMDYYHVGVVTSVQPLRILHCTSPGGFTTDTRLGHWAFRARLSLIAQEDSVRSSAPTLRQGSRGGDVAQAQLRLRALGYRLEPDGIFGPITKECVRTYQGTRGLEPDGIVGPMTWAALLGEEEAA